MEIELHKQDRGNQISAVNAMKEFKSNKKKGSVKYRKKDFDPLKKSSYFSKRLMFFTDANWRKE